MQKTFTKELATRQNVDFYALSSILPDPDTVLASQGRGISLYRELLNDPHVRACTMSRKSGVLSKPYEFIGEKASVELVKGAFARLDFEQIVTDILNAPLFGFQPIEVVWKYSDVKPKRAGEACFAELNVSDVRVLSKNSTGAKYSDVKPKRAGEACLPTRGAVNFLQNTPFVVPEKVEAKPQEWFSFDVQNRLRLRTNTNFYEGEIVPERKFLCPRHNPSYLNPYGEKLLSSVFWAVTFKKGGMKFWVSFAEKYGMPWALGRIPRQTLQEEALRLRDALDNMVQDGVAVFDDACSVELIESGSKSQSSAVYADLVNFNNEEISKAILGQTLTTQVGQNGSYAAGKVHSEVRSDIVAADVKLVEKTVNQLIEWFFEINFPSLAGTCKFVFSDGDNIKSELAARDKVLCDAGVGLSKEYFMRTYGFSPEDIAG